MGYDLGAQAEAEPGGLSFSEAKQQIEEVENKFNLHGNVYGAQNLQGLNQQGLAREVSKK